jgi:hypothetical protein
LLDRLLCDFGALFFVAVSKKEARENSYKKQREKKRCIKKEKKAERYKIAESLLLHYTIL